MKQVMMMYLKNCPYCRKAFSIMEELRKEYPEYNTIPIEYVEENEQAELAERYDYWYVPTYYVDGKKLHEGAITKEEMETVFQAAL